MRRAWLIGWATLLVAGCGDETAAVDFDFGRPDSAAPAGDAAPPRDMLAGPDSALGSDCTDGADCPSGFCVAHDDGRRVCTERCGNDDDCPDDWLCRQVSNAGPDVTFICVPEASPCGGVDLERDPDNCGACGAQCLYGFAEGLCVGGACAMGPCLEGHHDLDGDPATGCEYPCTTTRDGAEACDEIDNDCDGMADEDFDLSTSVLHCGGCGQRCELPNATPLCELGRCVVGRCDDGHGDFDDDPSNGCEPPPCVGGPERCDGIDNDCDGMADEDYDFEADPEHCGGCGVRCAPPGAEGACAEGVCAIARCEPGRVDLDGEVDTGCECPVGSEVCNGADDDCDGEADEGFDLAGDALNCGACGAACALADATAACVAGSCAVERCRDGFVDRDGVAANGCECRSVTEVCDGVDDDCDGVIDEGFDLAADVRHCGACGVECRPENAEPACVDGACTLAGCRDGAVDLDGVVDNGCEYLCRVTGGERCNAIDDDCDGAIDEGIDLRGDVRNCGACGQVCVFANAEPSCVAGGCVMGRCLDGAVDLDGAPDNGCEYLCRATGGERCNAIDDDCDGVVDEGIALASDPLNCGRCGEVCAFANADAACVEGACRPGACRPGFVDLDGAPGCEYACAPVGDEVCDGRADEDCDGAIDEGFDLAADPVHCGGCGRVCAFARAEARCVDGQCRPGACDPGFFDLDGIPGCEYACVPSGDGIEACNAADDDCDGRVDEGLDLDADPDNCGRCGRSCAAPRSETACVDGDCRLVACAPGFVDLDGDLVNGCEYACVVDGPEVCDEDDDDCDGSVDEGFDLQADPDNCGLCGLGCGFVNAAALCVEGRCTAGPCEPGYVDLDDLPGCEYACVPAPDGLERCNGADDDCDGAVDEQDLAPCPVDRSGDFLVEADPDEQIVGGLLPIQFIPAILTLQVQPPDVSGEMTGPDGLPIVYVGTVIGDAMELTASYVDPSGLQHDETWEVVWDGVDVFAGIMTDRMSLPGFGLFDVLVWDVTGTRR